jgi:hypothetical protein
MYVMSGKKETKITSDEKNYEVREFLGNIVSKEEAAVISTDLTIAEAQRLINELSAKSTEE